MLITNEFKDYESEGVIGKVAEMLSLKKHFIYLIKMLKSKPVLQRKRVLCCLMVL